jgi:multiple sugar transport system permease protein
MTTSTTPQSVPASVGGGIATPPVRPGGTAITSGSRLGRISINIGIALIIIYCLAPFYWMIVSSFRRQSDTFSNSPLPIPFSTDNYESAFDPINGFGRSLVNSLIVAGTTTILVLIIGILTAYALARLEFRFKNVALGIIIATSMFPGITLLVPLLRLFTDIGWINTYQAMIVPSMSFALPLAVPGVFTTAIITFIEAWNEFIIALSVINKPELKTAPVITSQFTGATNFDTPFGTIMAAGVIVTIPLVIMVLIFQQRIVAGLTAGGVK